MSKIIRRCIAILLCATAIILLLIPSNDASATTTKGDYVLDGSTLVSYIGNETEVTIPNTITAIGDDAFSKNAGLFKVVIPDSVKTIGHAAFEGCENLSRVTLGKGIKSIGSAAFSGCKSLQVVNIPERCNELGSGVFAGCTILPNVSIDSGNRNFVCVDGVIYSKDGSTLYQYLGGRPSSSFTMPSTVSKIGEYAFWGADSLNSVSVSNQVKEIPEYAFSNCSSLSKVTLPRSVESLLAYSFENCPSLRKISMPDSVGYIDEKAFYLSNGAKIEFTDANGNNTNTVNVSDVNDAANEDGANVSESENGNSTESTNNESLTEFSNDDNQNLTLQPEGYTPSRSGSSNWINVINSRDFADNKINNELGSGLIVGGNAMFIMRTDIPLKGFDIESAENEDMQALSGGNTSLKGDTFEIINGVLASYNGNEELVQIPENVTRIGERAFYKNNTVKDVFIPSSVKVIDDFAFARSSVEVVDIPEGVERIGYAAFYQCPNLNKPNIPSSINRIDLGAFDGSKFYTEWQSDAIDGPYFTVGNGLIIGYKGNGGNIEIPEGTTQICAGSFDSNDSITSLLIPSTVKRIGEDAFNECTNLKNLTLSEGITEIEDRAFGNTALSIVSLPDTIESLGLGCFDTTGNGSPLKTVILSGLNIPNVTYNDTSSRLSARDLRTDALNGVENLIVKPNTDLSSGTLLNPKYYGFHGNVYCLSADSTDEQGLLRLLKSTSKPDEMGIVNIDPHVRLGSSDYIMNGVKEHAFDDYLSYNEWCDNKPVSVNVDGNSSNELNQLLKSLTDSIPSEAFAPNGIKVIVNGNKLTNDATASIPDYNEKGTLIISEDDGNRQALLEGMYSFYGSNTNVSLLPLELDLYDKTGTILIHKFGDSKMDVSLALPQMFENADAVMVASLDTDGALTELPTGISSRDGKQYLDFVANHCSIYGIYVKNESTVYSVNNNTDNNSTEITNSDNNSYSDNSGDLTNTENGNNVIKSENEGLIDVGMPEPIEESSVTSEESFIRRTGNGIVNTLSKSNNNSIIKYILVLILLSAAGILFLYKPKIKK